MLGEGKAWLAKMLPDHRFPPPPRAYLVDNRLRKAQSPPGHGVCTATCRRVSPPFPIPTVTSERKWARGIVSSKPLILPHSTQQETYLLVP